MTDALRVLDNLGPYLKHPPVAAFCDLSKRTFELFHGTRGLPEDRNETPRQHLLTRLVYIGGATSTAIRLNCSWALSLPAMSLARDRYEQTVRYSWLARQSDNEEMVKFLGTYYAKANKVFRAVPENVRDRVDKMAKLEGWMIDTPTKEQKAYLSRWETLDLASMAKKRDALPSKVPGKVASETLADLYPAIYQQFSSVSHGDMYSVGMLGLHKAPGGNLVLAVDPHWPAVICCYNALFDLIQCHEALAMDASADGKAVFDELFDEWRETADRMPGPS